MNEGLKMITVKWSDWRKEKRGREGGREWRKKCQINKTGCKEWWACCDPARGGDGGTNLS